MNKITTPTLLIDTNIVAKNITRMVEKANASKVIFRPHFKTHQSIQIGNIFKNFGIHKITVSSVSMAAFFAQHGWHDITIAFPVNILEADVINQLAEKVTLNLLVESEYVVRRLSKHLKCDVGLFIKIDTGYHRTGLSANSGEIEKIISFIAGEEHLTFKGFLTHAGHSYHTHNKAQMHSIAHSAKTVLNLLKQKYIGHFPHLLTSYGDTPTCSIMDNCSGFDEIRPGNFVYFDVMQYHLGSCKLDDIAVAVACPVVAVHPQREEVVIYGGAVYLSKENIEADNGFKLYGYVVNIHDNGWGEAIPGAYVSALSQEHGIVKMPLKYLNNIKPGDLLGILPVHSCLAANLLKKQLLIK